MQLQSIAAILEYTHIHLYIYVQWEFLETLKRRDYTTETIFLGYILLHTPYQSTLHIGTSNLDLRTAVVFWMSQPFDSHPEAKQVDLGMEESH